MMCKSASVARLTHRMLTSPRRFRPQLVLAAALSLVGCSRYEWRPVRADECAHGPAPRDSLLVTAAPESPGSIVGVVIDDAGQNPLNRASVELTGRHRVAFTDVTGAFRLDSVPPGAYLLTIRLIAYHERRVDSVAVTPAAGARVRVPLRVAPNDGCPGFLARRVRKPWWKWW